MIKTSQNVRSDREEGEMVDKIVETVMGGNREVTGGGAFSGTLHQIQLFDVRWLNVTGTRDLWVQHDLVWLEHRR